MRIYTKTGNYHGYFERTLFVSLNDIAYEPGSVFWYDQHDYVRNGVNFRDCLNEVAWQHLRNDATSKIVLFYADEYYNLIDLEDWATTIKTQKIQPNQIYIMCVDDNWVGWTVSQFAKLGIKGINIQSYNLLMNRVAPKPPLPLTHKFSSFSRNYNKWRLQLFVELFNKDLLTDFNYTFNNLNPYGKVHVYPLNQVKKDVTELGYTLDNKLETWINGMPYTVENNHIQEKLATDIYNKILSSGINLVVESHFDPFWNFKGHRHLDAADFSPAFPTEKVYKAIGCRRPFIIFSTPNFLKEFRQLCYKTFQPYIDESYDNIKDDVKRLQAIVQEVERISKLPTEEYNELIDKCELIAKHNITIMLQLKREVIFKENFKWLEPYRDQGIILAPGGEGIWG
jgi:hypothetical protein